MEKLTLFYIIYSSIIMLYIAFRWSMKDITDSLIKMTTFVAAIIGIILILKHFTIIN